MMRPYIICHMLSSVDGKIDGAALGAVTGKGEYEATGAKGPRPVFVARRAKSYAISVDTLGKLQWSGGDLDGDHLICVVSEQASPGGLPVHAPGEGNLPHRFRTVLCRPR